MTGLLHYRDLFREVSFYCSFGLGLSYGEDPPAPADMTEQQREVDRYVREGVRQFYDAPGSNNHCWSFLSPDLEMHLHKDRQDYPLPCDFGWLLHSPRFVTMEGRSPSDDYIRETSPDLFRRIDSARSVESRGRPLVCMIRPFVKSNVVEGMELPQLGERGLRLWVHPVPDRTYRIVLQYRANNVPISLENPHPLGAEWHHDTIRAACLAAAEKMRFPAEFDQRAEFRALLADSVLRDRNMNRGSWLGANLDKSDQYEPRPSYRPLRASGFPVWESSG